MSSTRSLPCSAARSSTLAVGAVIVAENLGMFQKLAARDALLELLAADEMIVFAVISCPRGARVV